VLAHGLAEGQAFIDGNKRVALIGMLTFLEVNDYRLELPDPDLANLIIGLSSGTTPEVLAGRIRLAMMPVIRHT
jgi:death-on-curing protein